MASDFRDWPTLLFQSIPRLHLGQLELFNITIENVVASVNLNQPINLHSIAKIFPSSKYKPNEFPGLVYRMTDPKVCMLVFSTGRLVVAGAKSQNMVNHAVSKLVDELKTKGTVLFGEPNVTIRNVVASAELGHRVDLEDADNILEGTIYEPEQFPGMIYRVKGSKVTILIFSSGKLVCAGALSESDVEKSVNRLYEFLAEKGLVPKANQLNLDIISTSEIVQKITDS